MNTVPNLRYNNLICYGKISIKISEIEVAR